MTASVPKRVFPLESPLTARAGPYMYLSTADNSISHSRCKILPLHPGESEHFCYDTTHTEQTS